MTEDDIRGSRQGTCGRPARSTPRSESQLLDVWGMDEAKSSYENRAPVGKDRPRKPRMMSSENAAIVREVYEAFNRSELPAVWPLMQPGVSLVEPLLSRMPYTGLHTGPRSVTDALFRYEAELWEDFRAVPEPLLYTHENVVVLGSFEAVGRESGEARRIPFFHEYFLSEGKIARIRSYPVESPALGVAE